MAMSGVREQLLTREQLTPIIDTLQGTAGKKELRVASAYNHFMKEKLAAGKAGTAGGCKGWTEVGALWKSMSDKQKQPYLKMSADDKQKAEVVKKEWSSQFDKHWAAIEAHMEAEENIKKERIQKGIEDKKLKAATKKKMSAERKKQKMSEKKQRIARSVRTTRTPASGRGSADTIASLTRGLDTTLWEVRESTNKPGFLYYLNKKTRQSQAERPKAGVKRAAEPQSRQPKGQRR
jgi:hypothetical protein